MLHGRRRIVASRDLDPVRVEGSPEYSSRAADDSTYFRLFLTSTVARDESESMMLASSTISPASRRSLESAAASSAFFAEPLSVAWLASLSWSLTSAASTEAVKELELESLALKSLSDRTVIRAVEASASSIVHCFRRNSGSLR